MIQPTITGTPLDFDVSLSDFFNGFSSHYCRIGSRKISYQCNELTITEPIGAAFDASTLLFYPQLCQELRYS